MTTVTEIASDVYRISTYASDYGMQFNQFLLNGVGPRRVASLTNTL